MKDNFDACVKQLLSHEGGYVNDPRDPGGETNRGISKRAYPHENIREMTEARARFLYRRDYWDANRCDELPSGIDHIVFDAAVNSGRIRAGKWLQQALGISADGIIGPATIAQARKQYAPAVIERAAGFRMVFLRGLPTWDHYKTGWTRRVDAVRKLALALASHEPVRPDVEPPPPKPAPTSQKPVLAAVLALLAAVVAYFVKG
jgi:lysozyme family protein